MISQRYTPMALVAVKTSCIATSPGALLRNPNATQNPFEIKNSANPQPEYVVLIANSNDPTLPVIAPHHSSLSMID